MSSDNRRFVRLKEVDRMLLCASDFKAMQILTPRPSPKPAADPDPPGAPSSGGAPPSG